MDQQPVPPGATTAGVIAPPPLIFAVPLLLGLLVGRRWPLAVVPSELARPLGIALMALGVVVIPALLAFRRARTHAEPWKPTKALVTEGPYRFTRNPMYLGITLGYLGVAIWRNVAWPVIALPAVLWVMQVGVIAREERYLESLFGERYREYCRRVRRWI
ncbi:MAG: isoprenylcysteine carboxylmethyltransferase family protein [Gemmatimonadales bacterium]|nr:isoprenylcysteine carboxylmethyltransferase family protein [Gemmatimonadales bacterium]